MSTALKTFGDKKPIHIAFFNRSFYPETAATGQLLTELCQGLVKDFGCTVSVVAGPRFDRSASGVVDRSSLIFDCESYEGIQVYRARGTRFSKKRFAGRFSNYVSYFLCACMTGLRLKKPDILVALTDPPIIGLAAWVASRRFGAPFVMSFRDIFPEVARLLEDFHSPLVEKILLQINYFLIRKAERIISLGPSMSRRLIEGKKADPSKIFIIPDWADCSEIYPVPKQNSFSIANNLTDKFVVMHSGNIGLSQSLETLVEAAAILEPFQDIRIVFVGDGTKKNDLEQMVNSQNLRNVIFLPYQPKESLRESFSTADVFVILLKEGMAGYIVPSKLYGILAAGKPYVAAVEEQSEAVEIAKKYDCGIASCPSDPSDLAEKILLLYRDETKIRTMGENARKAALQFDRTAGIQAYYKMFSELLRTNAVHSVKMLLTGESAEKPSAS